MGFLLRLLPVGPWISLWGKISFYFSQASVLAFETVQDQQGHKVLLSCLL